MPSIWALIVGVCQYAVQPWATGADIDARNVRDYLREHLKVPQSNIIVLRNAEATRAEILHHFVHHLIRNPNIKPGDALLFHFSGHGARETGPQDWPLPDEDNPLEENKGKLELFLPYDESAADADGYEIPGIPDRTLAALLQDAADTHGRNITVVLDCCHSGHGTRGDEDEGSQFVTRGVDPSRLTKLRSDTDKAIWNAQRVINGATGTRGFKTNINSMSHVLVAACAKTEEAQGNKNGGLFTQHWLQALKRSDIHPRSYTEVVKALRREMGNFIRVKGLKFSQNPHCEGAACDRVVFEDLALDQMLFKAEEVGNRCKINAGDFHGVKAGTVFDIYEVDPNTSKPGRVLGTAVARKVDSLECLADLAGGVTLSNVTFSARVSQQAYPLKFTIVNTQPESQLAQRLHGSLEHLIGDIPLDIGEIVTRVEDRHQADLIMEVVEESPGEAIVILDRRDAKLRDLATTPPHLDDEEVKTANFPNFLNAISRFNFFLAQTNPIQPFSKNVTVKLHVLENDFKINYLGHEPLWQARALSEEVEPEGDSWFCLEDASEEYAFVLQNNGDTPLFVYMTFFDTGTYEISTCYSPYDQQYAVLQPGGTLQLGASPEYKDPFSFFIREGDTVDTCFVKFYLLDCPTTMAFMDQRPQVGCDENGVKYIRPHRDISAQVGIQIPPQKGQWDCITTKVDIIRAEGASET